MHRAFKIVNMQITRNLITLFFTAIACQLPLFMITKFQFVDKIYYLIITVFPILIFISFWIISVKKTLKLKDISYPFISLLFYIFSSTLLVCISALFIETLNYYLKPYLKPDVPQYIHKTPVISNIIDITFLLFFIIFFIMQPSLWHLLAAKIEKRKLTFRIHCCQFFTFVLLTVIGYIFLSPIISLFESSDQNTDNSQRVLFSLIFSFISSEGIYYLWLKELFDFEMIEKVLKKMFSK